MHCGRKGRTKSRPHLQQKVQLMMVQHFFFSLFTTKALSPQHYVAHAIKCGEKPLARTDIFFHHDLPITLKIQREKRNKKLEKRETIHSAYAFICDYDCVATVVFVYLTEDRPIYSQLSASTSNTIAHGAHTLLSELQTASSMNLLWSTWKGNSPQISKQLVLPTAQLYTEHAITQRSTNLSLTAYTQFIYMHCPKRDACPSFWDVDVSRAGQEMAG